MFGLDSSDEAVAEAAADPNATDTDLGTPLTVAEVADMAAEGVASQTVSLLEQTVAAILPGLVNTVFVDPANPLQIDVAMPVLNCTVLDTLDDLTSLSVQPVQVVSAVSEAANNDALQTLNDALPSLQDSGVLVDQALVDPQSGRLEIELDSSSIATSEQLITALVGPSGIDITLDGVVQQAANARTDPSTSHVYGGEDITNGSGRCTSNISTFWDPSGTANNYVLTAGHCWTTTGTAVSQNASASNLYDYSSSKTIGKSLKSPVHSGAVTSCDCLMVGGISGSRATNDTLVDKDALYAFSYFAQNEKYFTGSPKACESGVTEYETYVQDICGKVSNASVTEKVNNDNQYSYTVTDTFAVSYPSGTKQLGGDSGGPVGSGATLLGVVTTSGNPGYESKVRNLTHIYSGAHVIVTGH